MYILEQVEIHVFGGTGMKIGFFSCKNGTYDSYWIMPLCICVSGATQSELHARNDDDDIYVYRKMPSLMHLFILLAYVIDTFLSM